MKLIYVSIHLWTIFLSTARFNPDIRAVGS
jgi:hypothetical protein